jgi:hypothetical protein
VHISKYDGEWKENKRNGKGTSWVKDQGKLRKEYTGNILMDEAFLLTAAFWMLIY